MKPELPETNRITLLRTRLWSAGDIRTYFHEGRDAAYAIVHAYGSKGSVKVDRDKVLSHYGTDFDKEITDYYKEIELRAKCLDGEVQEIENDEQYVEALCKRTTLEITLASAKDSVSRTLVETRLYNVESKIQRYLERKK